VAILYNRQSLVLGAIDGGDNVMLSLLGCHRALCERQIPVDFINEDDLRRGAASRYAVVYLPYSYAMDGASVAAVRRYVADGGTLWADGPTAWKDDCGKVRPEFPGGLIDVFGVKVEDILPAEAPFSLTPHDTQAGEVMRLSFSLRGAEVLAKDGKGHGLLLRHGAHAWLSPASGSAGGRMDRRRLSAGRSRDEHFRDDRGAARVLSRHKVPGRSCGHLDQSRPGMPRAGRVSRHGSGYRGSADRAPVPCRGHQHRK
jgi:hypothetical protein